MKVRPCYDIPERPPLFSPSDWHCCQYRIKNMSFFHSYYLCPKLWEILSTLFSVQLKHGKQPLASIIQGVCGRTLNTVSASEGTSSDQCPAEGEKGGPELGARLSGHLHLCTSSAFHGEQPGLLLDCKFNSLRSRLGSSIPDGRSHLLIQLLLQKTQTFCFFPLISNCIILSSMMDTLLTVLLHEKYLWLSHTTDFYTSWSFWCKYSK